MIDKKQRKTKLRVYTHWLVVLFYMTMIFYFSSQDGTKSHNVSAGLLGYIKLAVSLFSERFLEFFSYTGKNYEFFLRKTAHFTEYFVLSLLFYKTMIVSNIRAGKSIVITLAFCFLYAVSDEIHQIFVPGRAFALRDVIIDTLGAAFGLSVLMIGKIIKERTVKCKE
ncbi:MAG TPA: VanZ family protein [Clostridiales bacterium]|nr:VanZ family protein [Clostridiales bacterium]